MPDHVSKFSLDEEATSRTSSQARQPSWMSHWTRKNPEVASKINDSSLVCNNDRVVDLGGKFGASPSTLNMAIGLSKYGKGVINESKEMLPGMITETKKQGNFKYETTDLELGTTNLSLALALGRGETSNDLNLRNESILRSNEKYCAPNYCAPKKMGSSFGLPPHGSKKADTSRPVVVFERHFSNDNFTCLGKEGCKYQKYSSLLFHETDMKNDLTYEARQNDDRLQLQNDQSEKTNFQNFFGKKQSTGAPNHLSSRLRPTYKSHQSNIDHGKSRLSENVSVRNVETMRISTMVDSVENSPEGYQKISQRDYHVLFTKETCAKLTAHCEEQTFGPFDVSHGMGYARPSGVKIQPLWTPTDSGEKENTGNSSVFKACSKNEDSVEADSRQENAPQSRLSLSGKTSSTPRKENTVDENIPAAVNYSSTEKTRAKRPLLEIPDINEELPWVQLQPATSSTDYDEPSTSRVHSLNAKHLFSNKQSVLNHSCNDSQDHSTSPEASTKILDPANRWFKRLKRSTSDSISVGSKTSAGEDSSHQKVNTVFNGIVKSNRESLDPKLPNHRGKEKMEHLESVVSKRDSSTKHGCSWIQRWCQNNTIPRIMNSETNVICEPHSLKIAHDEIPKKEFPSIAALALMGKAMNGYQPCEFRKRGSVVVWNTRDF